MDERMITAPDGVSLHVGVSGSGPDVVVLSGGPGCVHYLEDDRLVPHGMRAWFPEPRGVGRSGGGPHTMAEAVVDLEAIRESLGISRWSVLGHSWGSELAVRYALQHPDAVAQVISVAGRGPQRDRTWSQIYEAGKPNDVVIEIANEPAVWKSLSASFTEWIHHPTLFRDLADSPVPMAFIAAGGDIRPPWPLKQLAELVPGATFQVVPDVPHDFWSTHPDIWVEVVTAACAAADTARTPAA
ncbi:hydrolase [Mangrovactinospora gilvigrisea]|uniref:prolyl aminopeptidase n=1 Tax=Mangrovactinospora gilvigrisea TaxID=1428644 RepID=A0A1J7BLN7_9ACTN|nr:alpha/beta hydrolase [Mangrovactinospora gilvigrisea]OIV39517.1 hydrolase [Mangrovactinospora gilvigrisea]